MADSERPAERDAVTTEPGGDDVRQALDEANRQSEEYLDLLRRTRADFQNYRRRTDEQRAEQALSARGDMVLKILPVLDDFQRAAQSPPVEPGAREWAQGVLLIERKLRAVLESEGVQKIEAEGREFNPWEMEAISYQASPELEEGKVLAVAREGYKLGDKVIRPAQVVVARNVS